MINWSIIYLQHGIVECRWDVYRDPLLHRGAEPEGGGDVGGGSWRGRPRRAAGGGRGSGKGEKKNTNVFMGHWKEIKSKIYYVLQQEEPGTNTWPNL